MSEIALWRAVIQQALTDSQLTPDPVPVIPPLAPRKERKALSVEDQNELKRARLVLLHERLRVLNEHKAKAEAIAWFRDEGLDFRRICSWADLDPAYVKRKLA
jgi:hypothetical protein